MFKRLLLALATVTAVAAGLAPAAAAQDTRIVIRPGDGITFSTAPVEQTGACSIAAAGRDSAGRLIGLTAGHCIARPGTNAAVYKAGEQTAPIGRTTPVFSPGSVDWFGVFVTNNRPDYAALVLDETKVRYEPTSATDAQGEKVTITGTRTLPLGNQNIGVVCSAGFVSKVSCTTGQGVIVRSNLINSHVPGQSGDSGGALVDSTGKLLGVLTGHTFDVPSLASTRIDVIVKDMNAKSSFGAGWTPITA